MDLLESIRSVLGNPDFYIENGSYSGQWDYGAMTEYFVAGIVLCVVISSVFKLLRSVFQ